ncbi:MAG TPA: class I SAM-dependent methyltransferase [Candidatus Binatia bacterium]|nr:class I SAM-dependent methyltransferase [Candidatus Binatia bacterium]
MEAELYEKFYDIEEHFWWSVGTRRTFLEVINETLVPIPSRVLDLGCGTGIMLKELATEQRFVCGYDGSSLALSFCHRRGLNDLVQGDASVLPFGTECLDLVTALDVIEHLDDDEGCVREMARVCRRGGHVLIHVPAFPFLWSYKDELNHHRRRYRRKALTDLIERNGLKVLQVHYLNSVAFPAAMLMRALGRNGSKGDQASVDALGQLYDIPASVNRLMTHLMDLERWLGRYVPPPFGMSLLCLAQKPI